MQEARPLNLPPDVDVTDLWTWLEGLVRGEHLLCLHETRVIAEDRGWTAWSDGRGFYITDAGRLALEELRKFAPVTLRAALAHGSFTVTRKSS
jgi:hypothetical protein